jgi:hypothetical protein
MVRKVIQLVCVFSLVPLLASASSVIRTSDVVQISEDQVVSGDFYAGGDQVLSAGEIEGDMYTAALQTVIIHGEIEDDLVAVGQKVLVTGSVGDDVRIAAGNVIIEGVVGSDVVIAAENIAITSDAEIGADALFFADSFVHEGVIKGAIKGYARDARIDGEILGDVELETRESLTLGSKAHLHGDLRYISNQDLVRAIDATVVGDITKERVQVTVLESREVNIMPVIILLFTTLMYVLILRNRVLTITNTIVDKPVLPACVGIAAIFVSPVLAAFLLLTVLGIPIGITFLFAYVTALTFAWSFGGVVVGVLLARYIGKTDSIHIFWMMIGAVVYAILPFIPFIGLPLMLLISCMVLGVLVVHVYQVITSH